jgi:hypothetical protein
VEMEQRPSFPLVRHLGNVQWCCMREMHPLEDARDLRSALVHQQQIPDNTASFTIQDSIETFADELGAKRLRVRS